MIELIGKIELYTIDSFAPDVREGMNVIEDDVNDLFIQATDKEMEGKGLKVVKGKYVGGGKIVTFGKDTDWWKDKELDLIEQ